MNLITFLVSIGPQLASNISSSTNHMVYMNTVANSIFIPYITTIEVMNVILLLKNSCAGWDDIPAYVMKRCINVYYIEPTLFNKIMSSLDTGDLVIGVFLDLKKAFDTVDHKILLDKMHAYGIRGNILRWFRSYLTNRSQFASYDGRQSEIQSISCGVPQGSILGPLLFIIYRNDICNVSE